MSPFQNMLLTIIAATTTFAKAESQSEKALIDYCQAQAKFVAAAPEMATGESPFCTAQGPSSLFVKVVSKPALNKDKIKNSIVVSSIEGKGIYGTRLTVAFQSKLAPALLGEVLKALFRQAEEIKRQLVDIKSVLLTKLRNEQVGGYPVDGSEGIFEYEIKRPTGGIYDVSFKTKIELWTMQPDRHYLGYLRILEPMRGIKFSTIHWPIIYAGPEKTHVVFSQELHASSKQENALLQKNAVAFIKRIWLIANMKESDVRVLTR